MIFRRCIHRVSNYYQWGALSLLIAIVPFSALSQCDGAYRNGIRPAEKSLNQIIANHILWRESLNEGKPKNQLKANLCGANLSGMDLSGVNLAGADLSEADLSGANLSWADLSEAYLFKSNLSHANLEGIYIEGSNLLESNLQGAYLSWAHLGGANLSRANLTNANLAKANLSGVNLSWTNVSNSDLTNANLSSAKLINTNLDHAKISHIDVRHVIYEPNSVPDIGNLSEIQGLITVTFGKGEQSSLVMLRNSLQEAGLRHLERQATYVIQKSITDSSDQFVKYLRRVFFEYTAGYGLFPGRCLEILLFLIPAFAVFYYIAITINSVQNKVSGQNGVYRIWDENRICAYFGSSEPELVVKGNGGRTLWYAFYFSVLSAFYIGWRDLNVGNWITRIQPHEYTLQSTGWVRTLSGIQSLISVYLLAFWVLTEFGRPFS